MWVGGRERDVCGVGRGERCVFGGRERGAMCVWGVGRGGAMCVWG